MLKQINIKNYALAEDVRVQFEPGFNVITGETGAGKSIIIDALGLLLGNRASKEIVRTGMQRAVIEGQWDVSQTKKLKPLLQKNQLEFSDELFIRREITEKGTSRALINDAVVPLTVLNEITQWLVDLHGQHQHQLLLNVDNHIQFFDDVILSEKDRNPVQESYANVLDLRARYAELRKNRVQLQQQRRIQEYEFEELEKAGLEENEWDNLEKELKTLENAEVIIRDCHQIEQMIGEGNESLASGIDQIIKRLQNLSKYESEFGNFLSEVDNAQILFSEIASYVDRYKGLVDFDAERIENLRQRHLYLKSLQKKFNKSHEELMRYYASLKNILSAAENIEDQFKAAEKSYQEAREKFGLLCQEISAKRESKIDYIRKAFEKILEELGMNDAQFQIRMWREEANGGEAFYEGKYLSANENGFDRMEYYISPNPGEDFKPLIKIASGGEISRIMLALKTILASSDRIPSLVFDEIDSGISGQIAQKVGKAMKKLAEKHQIICITHLPQIAAFADHHYKVSKFVETGRTFTHVTKLTKELKIKEIADLIAGEQEFDEILKTAETLLKNAN